ncbi:MAG: hypothetical protein RSB36_03405 [Hydrogenoanaerobacterium sp.]
MDFEVLLVTDEDECLDISEFVSAADVTDNINKVGSCTLSIAMSDEFTAAVGNAIRVQCRGETYFVGYITDVELSNSKLINVTAYDQLFYLQASDTFVFENATPESVIKELCGVFRLRTGTLEATSCKIGRKLFDGKKALDVIADCLSLALTKTKEMYYIKDEGGSIILRSIRSSISNLLIDTESIMSGYSYKCSINDGVNNQIKLVRDNKATGKRELYMAKDSGNIKKWGLLQYYEKLDDAVNPEQAKQKADALLFLKNRVKETLTLDALGASEIRAGAMLCVSIPEIGFEKFVLCRSAKHSFTNTTHTVKVDLRLV